MRLVENEPVALVLLAAVVVAIVAVAQALQSETVAGIALFLGLHTGIVADVAELVDRGIEFEEYDMDAFKTINQVVTSPGIGRSAWFRDPDGNTIVLFQPE